MCGRYTQTSAFDELAGRFGITVLDDDREDLTPRYNTAPPPINAKAETLATSRMFQDALTRGRCLVPADGFYEWKAVAGQKRKQPYYVKVRDGLFAFAGLWTPSAGPGLPPTCTIITTAPNELLAEIHDRMPAILEHADEDRWLDPRLTDPAVLLALLRPLPAERMEAYPVSALVSSPGNEGPELVEPLSR